jgi:predicted transcriptional regulator
MASDARALFGPLEAEVMDALWATGEPMSVRTVLDALNESRRQPLAYTTVMTVMTRLAEKQVLRRTAAGRAFVYEPRVSNEAAAAVRGVVRNFGSAAVAQFVEEARADPALLERLEGVLKDRS